MKGAQSNRPVSADAEFSAGELDIRVGRLEQVRGDLLALRDDLLAGEVQSRAAHGDRARAERAGAGGHRCRVAFDDGDPFHRHAEPRAEDLREARSVALAMVMGPEVSGDAAAGCAAALRNLVEA